MFNPIAQPVMDIGIPTKAKAETKIHPLTVEAKTRKCSI